MSTLQATNLKHGSSASNNIVLDASGNTTISGSAAISGSATITGALQANGVTGSLYPLASGTAQASTSGTSIDFTGIPSWVKRITVMFNGVSTNGTSRNLIQIGSGSFTTSGYASNAASIGSGANSTSSSGSTTTGFVMNGYAMVATRAYSGHAILTNVSGNIWVCSGVRADTTNEISVDMFGGTITLSGTLDRVRLTTVNGTDTFDAGSINILYEG